MNDNIFNYKITNGCENKEKPRSVVTSASIQRWTMTLQSQYSSRLGHSLFLNLQSVNGLESQHTSKMDANQRRQTLIFLTFLSLAIDLIKGKSATSACFMGCFHEAGLIRK